MSNSVVYSDDIRDMILANLDNWKVETTPEENNENNSPEEETSSNPNYVDPFMTSNEATEKANKIITDKECRLFYEETLDQAYMYTNRLNIDDLSAVEARVFLRGVCKWTASNLWNKYNIRVNNEDLEDTYVQSYGGLLYKSALKTLNPFINQRITGLTRNTDDDDNIW